MASFITFKFRKNKRAYKKYLNSAASPTIVSPRSRTRVSDRSSAAISKSSNDQRQSLKLTVKAPPSKLREVMRANEIESLHDTLGGGQVIEGSRRRRNAPPARASGRAVRPRYAEYGESDLEDDDEEEDADEDMDDDDAAAEEDEDVDMDDAPNPPKAPKITLKPPAKTKQSNPKLLVAPANVGPVRSVEDQEMQDDPDDEEVEDSSELSDDDDEDEEEDEEDDEENAEEDVDQTNLDEEDAAGEEDDEIEVEGGAQEEGDELDEDDDSESGSDSETPGSGAATPDPAKMTKRQRRALDGDGFMALEMGPQQRKVS